MLTTAVLPISLGILGLIAAFLVYARILQTPAGDGRVKDIADEIHLGAMVFMASEYKRLAVFCVICIVALYASIPAMANAMALTLMVLAMYSVMAVTFYNESAEEYFGTFGKALFTLFQFSTGDGWTDVVRAIPFSSEIDSLLLSVFFVSFMIIVSIVLMQVVIAVLLEEFSKIGSEEAGPIGSKTDFDFSPNPFGVYMSQFSMAQDEEDLKTMIKMLFKAVVVSAGLVQQQPRTHGPQDEIADGLHVDKIRLDYGALHRGVLALQVRPPAW